jgi:cell envelope opacity-associated protein A
MSKKGKRNRFFQARDNQGAVPKKSMQPLEKNAGFWKPFEVSLRNATLYRDSKVEIQGIFAIARAME